MEEKKIFSKKEFEKLTRNMKIIEHDGYFDGYALYIFIEAKNDNESLWFIRLQAPNIKTKYLKVQEQDMKWLIELRHTDIEQFSRIMIPFLFS